MDIDMASQSRKCQRLQHLTQTDLCQYLDGAWDCHCQLGRRGRTSIHVEGRLSTHAGKAQVECLHTKAVDYAIAECVSHHALFGTVG